MDPDKRDYNIQGEPQTDIEYLKKYVARHLPGLEAEPSIVETCMYTVSALVVDWLFIRLSTCLSVCLSVCLLFVLFDLLNMFCLVIFFFCKQRNTLYRFLFCS